MNCCRPIPCWFDPYGAADANFTHTYYDLYDWTNINEYESNTGTIKSKQSALDSELKELNSSVKNKEKVLSDLENSASRKIPSMVTLTPGLYTVGENLFSGNYNAMGDGAIVVSSSNGGAKINTTLTSDAVSFTLEDGDIVKLETKAVFSRVQ